MGQGMWSTGRGPGGWRGEGLLLRKTQELGSAGRTEVSFWNPWKPRQRSRGSRLRARSSDGRGFNSRKGSGMCRQKRFEADETREEEKSLG